MNEEPLWDPVPNVGPDAYEVDIENYTEYRLAAWRRRSWGERLFSWPWCPWRSHKLVLLPRAVRP